MAERGKGRGVLLIRSVVSQPRGVRRSLSMPSLNKLPFFESRSLG